MTALLAVSGWLVAAALLAVLIGRGIRLADQRRPRPSRYPMHGGQVLMGPQQPRPRVQERIPGPPPRRGGGYQSSGEPVTVMPRAPRGPGPGGKRP